MGNALCGACVGLLLVVGSLPLLAWNEHGSVAQEAALAELRAAVAEPGYTGAAGALRAELAGRAVHAAGPLRVDAPAADAAFGVAPPRALRVRRLPEVWRTEERPHTTTRRTAGGGEESVTTFSYETLWAPTLADSSRFRDPLRQRDNAAAHSWRVAPEAWAARGARVGPIELPPAALERLGAEREVDLLDPAASLIGRLAQQRPAQVAGGEARVGELLQLDPPAAKAPSHELAVKGERRALAPLLSTMTLSGNALYTGSAFAPRHGDNRVRFTAAAVDEASVLGVQTPSGGLRPFRSSSGREILLVEEGALSPAAMLERASAANSLQTWAVRGAGWALQAVGLLLVLQPAAIAPEIIPLCGGLLSGLVGCAACCAAMAFATALTLVTVAAAWLSARPAFSALLFAAAAAVGAAAYYLRQRRGGSGRRADDKRD